MIRRFGAYGEVQDARLYAARFLFSAGVWLTIKKLTIRKH